MCSFHMLDKDLETFRASLNTDLVIHKQKGVYTNYRVSRKRYREDPDGGLHDEADSDSGDA